MGAAAGVERVAELVPARGCDAGFAPACFVAGDGVAWAKLEAGLERNREAAVSRRAAARRSGVRSVGIVPPAYTRFRAL